MLSPGPSPSAEPPERGLFYFAQAQSSGLRTASPPRLSTWVIDHGRLHILLAEEFLDSAEVVAILEQSSIGFTSERFAL